MISRLPPPIVLGLLYMLARLELRETPRLRGRCGALVRVLFVRMTIIGPSSGVVGASG